MIEEQIERSMMNNPKDKTFVDKILSSRDVEEIRKIVRKPELSREDMLDILYLMVGKEQKLLNYSQWDRVFLTKFFVWIRAFVELLENYYDYKEHMIEQGTFNGENERLYNQMMLRYQHATKSLVDLYLHLSRSTMSLGGSAFVEILKNKFEIGYTQPQAKEEKKGIFKW